MTPLFLSDLYMGIVLAVGEIYYPSQNYVNILCLLFSIPVTAVCL